MPVIAEKAGGFIILETGWVAGLPGSTLKSAGNRKEEVLGAWNHVAGTCQAEVSAHPLDPCIGTSKSRNRKDGIRDADHTP